MHYTLRPPTGYCWLSRANGRKTGSQMARGQNKIRELSCFKKNPNKQTQTTHTNQQEQTPKQTNKQTSPPEKKYVKLMFWKLSKKLFKKLQKKKLNLSPFFFGGYQSPEGLLSLFLVITLSLVL